MIRRTAIFNLELIGSLPGWFLGFLLTSYASFAVAEHKIGWLEPIMLQLTSESEVVIEAKIDSGADNSSIHADHIVYQEIDGQTYVSFRTIDNLTITRPLFRTTEIKTKKGGLQKRAVVQMNICIDGVVKEVEMNLVNRSHFSKPILMGRSALQGFLIDVSQTDITDVEKCRGKFD